LDVGAFQKQAWYFTAETVL